MSIVALEPLSLAEAEAEIHAHIFSRAAEQDHDAKMRRIARSLGHLGDPQDDVRVIHVMGTNGKTSTSRLAA